MKYARMGITVPAEIRKLMDRHPEINWSMVASNAFRDFISKLENGVPEIPRYDPRPDAEEMIRISQRMIDQTNQTLAMSRKEVS